MKRSASARRTRTASAAPSASTFFPMARSDAGESSTKSTLTAPRESAPSPSAPEPVGDVDYVNALEHSGARREPPPDRLGGAARAVECELEPIAAAEPRSAGEPHAARHEHRRRVADTERLEVTQHRLQLVARLV